ncbi:MAG TPA: NIPSNAP family protein [Methylovirgula sp.]
MLHEFRIYTALPGRMPNLLARFKDHTVSIWQKHEIVPIGFWTTLIGRSTRELTYILAWNSLADREAKWAAFQHDSDWLRVRDESERDGPIVESISSQILSPTSFSALA